LGAPDDRNHDQKNFQITVVVKHIVLPEGFHNIEFQIKIKHQAYKVHEEKEKQVVHSLVYEKVCKGVDQRKKQIYIYTGGYRTHEEQKRQNHQEHDAIGHEAVGVDQKQGQKCGWYHKIEVPGIFDDIKHHYREKNCESDMIINGCCRKETDDHDINFSIHFITFDKLY
jgi:hypothetical protein